MHKIEIALALVLIFAMALTAIVLNYHVIWRCGGTNEHAIFRIYVMDTQVNFTGSQYQADIPNGELCGKNGQSVYLTGGNGEVVHKHANGATWGDFLSTLGVKHRKGCYDIEGAGSYCDEKTVYWRVYLNGAPAGNLDKTEIRDKDRLLMSYDNDETIGSAEMPLIERSLEILSLTANNPDFLPPQNSLPGQLAALNLANET